MSDATVSVTPERDTADAQFAITDKRGAFSFKGLDPGPYHLIITFQGCRHVRKELVIDAAHRDVDEYFAFGDGFVDDESPEEL